jgi:peptide deformylase
MVLPVYIIGSPVLRKTAENINPDYPELKELIENMFETMNESEGVGLAAPQVGHSIRLFVIDSTPIETDENDSDFVPIRKAFINAKIIERRGDEIKSNEGCLSIPGVREDVYRDEIITIEYVDENFQQKKETFKGINSIIIQHEYDHLEGFLFTDKVSQLRKKLLKKRLLNISKGIFEKKYKFKLGK